MSYLKIPTILIKSRFKGLLRPLSSLGSNFVPNAFCFLAFLAANYKYFLLSLFFCLSFQGFPVLWFAIGQNRSKSHKWQKKGKVLRNNIL